MTIQIEMPRYKSHKEVWALKLREVRPSIYQGAYALVFEDDQYAAVRVSEEWFASKKPEAGGYYVVYPGDGYASYSPAKAFEEGYSLIAAKSQAAPAATADAAPVELTDEQRDLVERLRLQCETENLDWHTLIYAADMIESLAAQAAQKGGAA